MNMGPLAEAIADFRDRRLRVYATDPDQVHRDVNVVAETVKDHIGRWPLELIQNSDDAYAERILLKVTDGAVYAADNGRGLRPEAIKSLSGTHLSDKPVGAIGRKGLGFKAVYEITGSPQVFTHDGDGVVYSRDRACTELCRSLGKEFTGRVPHEWLPFWVRRREAEGHDPMLASLHDWATVVKLPLEKPGALGKALAFLADLPAHILLTFPHLRNVQIEAPGADRTVTCAPLDGPIWQVTDSSASKPTRWMVCRATKPVPADRLEGLEEHDRARMHEVSLLVAAPIGAEEAVVPDENCPKVCVYYPVGKDAEDGRAPVRLLLHGDFLVSSDRTQVLGFQDSPLNDWIAERLAEEVVTFIDKCYRSSEPASYLRLLLPYGEVGEHRLAKDLWAKIRAAAADRLWMPDANGRRRLKATEACFLATSVADGVARLILRVDPRATFLLHESVSEDEEARAVAKCLGAQAIGDMDIVQAIADLAPNHGTDADWVWACWEWLGEWFFRVEKWHPDRAKRLARIKSLPILPVPPRPVSRADLGPQTTVTWRTGDFADLPDWMPIRLVDDWFRDELLDLDGEHPVRTLLKELGVDAPTEDVFAQSLGHALGDYWRSPTGDPSRFLSFLVSRDWDESMQASKALQRCPVLVRQEDHPNADSWAEASSAYLGTEWGNDLLAGLYEGINGVVWAKRPIQASDKHKRIIRWLGVPAYPRVVAGRDDPDPLSQEMRRVGGHIKGNTHVQTNRVRPARVLEDVDTEMGSGPKAALLLRLIARHWDDYYAGQAKIEVACEGPRGGGRLPQTVPARWWEDLLTKCVPPCRPSRVEPPALGKCWLPDPETVRAIGPFLPAIDLDAFGEDRPAVESWLRQTVGLRTHLNQVSPSEWTDLLGGALPAAFRDVGSEDRDAQRSVQRFYEAALDSVAAQQTAYPALAGVPVLCRRGRVWKWALSTEKRWLADDVEMAEAFANDLWMMTFALRYHEHARKHFGLRSLKASVKVEEGFDPAEGTALEDLQAKLKEVAPFVYAWRRYSTKENPDALREKLFGLRVVQLKELKVHLALDEPALSRIVDRPFEHKDGVLILHADSADVVALARSLARALGLGSESANLLENIMRCRNDAERSGRLKTENIPPEQIKGYLTEFSQPAAPVLDLIGDGRVPTGDGPGQAEQRPVHLEKGPSPGERAVAEAGHGTGAGSESEVEEDEHARTSRAGEDASPVGEELKKVGDTPCVFRTTALPPPKHRGENVGKGEGGPHSDRTQEPVGVAEANRLDPAARKRIEERARDFAARELERLVYNVERMPFENEGFDLRATRGHDMLLVEVKGHRGSSVVADISDPQVKQCHRCSVPGSAQQWQLWNIEHLGAADEHDVIVTVVDRIPSTALEASSYRLDLRQCAPIRPI